MLETLDHGRVRELRLARPPANALNIDLMIALRTAIEQAQSDGVGALVLSGAPGRFSGGLDVPALLQLDRAGVREAWQRFLSLLGTLAHVEVPLAAALTGHAPAGGTVLALYADLRVMADGPFVLGLNEVQVGLPVPPFLLRTLAYVVGERQAARLATGGLLIPPAEALRVGLVDELVPPDQVVPRAVAWAHDLLSRPATALRDTRRLVRQPLRDAFADVGPALLDDVVERWHSDEGQATLRALAARLKKG